jgi:thiamine kinase-like enzyme
VIPEKRKDKMEQSPVPDWLDKEFLTSVLKDEVSGSNIAVTSYDVEPAVPKGDHFSSCLLRVTVDYTFKDGGRKNCTATSSFIVKSLPTAEIMLYLLTQTGIFQRETAVYLEALPVMYRLAEEITGSKAQYLTSRCIYSEPNILVLQDLNHLGYKMADRIKGLDLSHCQLALKSLARFHGMSVALHKKDPKSMSSFNEVFYKEQNRPIISSYMEPAIKRLASAIENWPGYSRFVDKIRSVAETSVIKVIEVVKPKEGSLSVLNHGDFWTNNIMFRYSSNEVVDSVFVDFQISRFSSPALDLQYFMYTSPTEEVRFKHMDDLLEFYHIELRKTLQVLGCSEVEFTHQQLRNEFEERAVFGLLTSCTLLNLILADPKDAVDLEHVTLDDMRAVEDNPMEKGFSAALYRETFKKLLIHFESKGLL